MAYTGVLEPRRAFEALRPALRRLQAMAKAHPHGRRTPASESLEHAVLTLRMAANLITHDAELYGVSPPDLPAINIADLDAAAEFTALRPALDSLREMARTYRPSSPQALSLDHAALAIRMAADLLTGRPDFFRVTVGDGTTSHVSPPAVRHT